MEFPGPVVGAMWEFKMGHLGLRALYFFPSEIDMGQYDKKTKQKDLRTWSENEPSKWSATDI